jgi:hypothetical protein
MTILHPLRRALLAIVDPCWLCVPGADGPPCARHVRLTAESVWAQSRPGYGLPGRDNPKAAA